MNKRLEIGNRVRKIRQDSNLNQEQMAKQLGISGAAISAYETGDAYPSLTGLIKIAKIGKVSLDWLIMGGEMLPRDLSGEESILLHAFQQISLEDQKAVLRIVESLAKWAIKESK